MVGDTVSSRTYADSHSRMHTIRHKREMREITTTDWWRSLA